jgi:hypothetical protein
MLLPEAFSQLSDRTIRRFAAYWLARRGGKLVPGRRDIDPVEIPWALPFIWLCDHLPEEREFRYRLAGEHINGAFRRNLRGRTMRDIVSPEIYAIAIARYLPVIDGPAVLHNAGPVYNHRGHLVTGERIAFPLSSDGGRVDMMVGVTVSQVELHRDGSVDGNQTLHNTYIPVSALPPSHPSMVRREFVEDRLPR